MTRKLTLTIISILLLTLMLSGSASAATTASLTPATVSVATGQQFNISISVNPGGTANYAEKVEVKFPADLLEVSSFTLGTNWMALPQSGYDLTDNTNGVLVKTAGYAGGFSSIMPFGTITFTAKKAGTGNISFGGNSSAFLISSQTALTGTGSAVSVKAATVVPKKAVTTDVKPKTVNTLAPITPPATEPVVPTSTVAETVETAIATQTAAVAEAVPGGSSSIIWIILAVVVVAVIGFLVGRRGRKQTL